jgi:hypothetical protein
MTTSAPQTLIAKLVLSAGMAIKTMFSDPNNVPFDRFEGLLKPIESAKAFKRLKLGFRSSTMVLINVTTFGVAIGTTAFAVEVEDEDRYKRHFFLLSCIAHSWLLDQYKLISKLFDSSEV